LSLVKILTLVGQLLLVKNLPHSSERCFVVRFAAVTYHGVYTSYNIYLKGLRTIAINLNQNRRFSGTDLSRGSLLKREARVISIGPRGSVTAFNTYYIEN
jgi:hypothetical protein